MLAVIKTEDLQNMINRVSKCSSNNKLIPITSLLNIKVTMGSMTLTTTDATNYYYAKCSELVECDKEDFEVSVICDTFTKLIQKTTSLTVALTVEDKILKVKGNGDYKLELPLDEVGKPIKFPNKIPTNVTNVGEIKRSDIDKVLAYNKASLATSVEIPSLTYYYCGDKVVTSDKLKICCTNIKLFNEPRLISSQVMELLGVLPNDHINVVTDDNALVFTSGSDVVYAPITMEVSAFPIAAIQKLLDIEFPYEYTVAKAPILEVLDRLSLFVSAYDKKCIYATFNNGMLLSSKKSSGEEKIDVESVKEGTFTCAIDIEMLKSQINTQPTEKVSLAYGIEMAIKLVSEDIVEIVSLSQDDRK